MKKIIISGANGFIGINLVKRMLDNDYYVIALIHKESKMHIEHTNLEVKRINLDEYEELSKMIPYYEYDAFVHLAWYGYGNLTNDYNVQLQNVLYSCEAAKQSSLLGCKKFVFADSFHEFLFNNVQNSTLLNSIYGAAKFSARRMCMTICNRENIVFNGLLISNVFGHEDYSNRSINFFIKSLIKNEELNLVTGEDLYDWVYIEDAINEIKLIIDNGKINKLYYIGTENPKTLKELILISKKRLNSSSKINFGVFNDDTFIDFTKFDFRNTFDELGYSTKYSLSEAITKYSKWVKENLL